MKFGRCRIILFAFCCFVIIDLIFIQFSPSPKVGTVLDLKRQFNSLHMFQGNDGDVLPLTPDLFGNGRESGSKLASKPLVVTGNQVHNESSSCDEECRWTKLQESRRNTVNDACTTFAEESRSDSWSNEVTKSVFDHVLVSDKFKLLYCYVPKVACTNWKKILLLLDGKNVSNVHEYPIRKLSQYSPQEAEERLRIYTKFMFVRNPHERLLSAYEEKFARVSAYSERIRHTFGRIISSNNLRYWMNKYHAQYRHKTNQLDDDSILNLTGTREVNGYIWISFQDFLRYVANIKYSLEEPPEEHWREMYRLCSPCSIHYDFIGKLDTLVEDAYYILKRAGAEHLVEIMATKPHATNSSNERIVEEVFAQVTEEDISQFERRYKKDMELFGYRRPTAITKFKSEDTDREESLEKLGPLLKSIE